MKPTRILYIDILRAISAILIVIYHFPYSWNASTDWLHGTVNGSWGMAPVFAFFMLSGVSLMLRYGTDDSFSIKTFYRKRFLSLFPLFWITYLFAFMLQHWIAGTINFAVPWYSIVWTVIGMDGWVSKWVPTYYVVGEWFFGSIVILYLLFPLLLHCWKKNKNLTMLVSTLMAAVLYWYQPIPMEIKQNPVINVFFFLAGAWIHEYRMAFVGTKLRRTITIGLSGIFLLITIAIPFARALPTMELSFNAQVSGFGIFLRHSYNTAQTFAYYLFFLCLEPLIRQSQFLTDLTVEISKKSFAMFLTHHVIELLIILRHFPAPQTSNRNLVILLIMTSIFTWIASEAVSRLDAKVRAYLR